MSLKCSKCATEDITEMLKAPKPCGNFCQIDENHSKADPNTPTQYLNLSTIAWSLTGDTFQWNKL